MSLPTDDLPQSKNHRNWFIAVVVLTCVALYWLDGIVTSSIEGSSENWRQQVSILKSIIENFIAGAIAIVLLALTYRWIVDWLDPGDRVIEVPPTEITERLIRNARRTRNYVFMGNTASFVSSAVLPILVESARTSGQPKVIRLFLIDPTDSVAVEAYVGHRDRVANGTYRVADHEQATWFLPQEKKVPTAEEVKAKVLATIYVAAYMSRFPGMEISIYLRRSFTPFRADISDSEAVLTQESIAEAAVAFVARGHFYGWYHKEADAQKGQCVHFDFTSTRDTLRRLDLVHPTDSKEKLVASIQGLLLTLSNMGALAQNLPLVEKTAKIITRPERPYR